jgi:Abnormal spindle-like microcephaly-assoc'd, ASPM-SPD-2-Hydin
MASARIDLIAVGDDDESRRRERRGGAKALAVLAGLVLLAFAERQPEPALRLDGGATDFGARQVGQRATEPIRLRNATDEPFIVAGIVAEGTASQQNFSVDMTRCGTIAPGTDCVASVSFAPYEVGPQSAKFRVIDASNEASQTIVVRGTGVIPPPSLPAVPPQPEPQPEPEPQPQPVSQPEPEPTPIEPTPPVVINTPPPAPVLVPVPKVEPAPKPEEPAPEPESEPEPDPVIEVPVQDTQQPIPEPVPQPKPEEKKESGFKRFLKKAAPVAIPLIVGAVIANNQDKGNNESQKKRRIEVSPRSVETSSAGRYQASVVTVTNVGTERVTIRSITLRGSEVFAQRNECEGHPLAPGQSCRITVGPVHPGMSGAATLVIDSDAGRETVSVSAKASQGKP